MISDLSPALQPLAPDQIRHLVVKRGHRGRYRFVMLGGGDRIGGEVWVGSRAGDPNGSRAAALEKIARLAEALLGGVTDGPSNDTKTEGGENVPRVDASAVRPHTILGEGDHRGEV